MYTYFVYIYTLETLVENLELREMIYNFLVTSF